jgi:hypothetical protein
MNNDLQRIGFLSVGYDPGDAYDVCDFYDSCDGASPAEGIKSTEESKTAKESKTTKTAKLSAILTFIHHTVNFVNNRAFAKRTNLDPEIIDKWMAIRNSKPQVNPLWKKVEDSLTIKVVTSSDECEAWVKEHRWNTIGMDSEWDNRGPTAGELKVVSMATLDGHCVVWHDDDFNRLWFHNLLGNPAIQKVFVDFRNDIVKFDCVCKSIVDVKDMAELTLGMWGNRIGKKHFFRYFFNTPAPNQFIRLGNWDTLTPKQIKYCAIDALVPLLVFYVLLPRYLQIEF